MSNFVDNGRVHVFDNVFFLDTIRVYIPCRDLCTEVKLYQYEYGSNGNLVQIIPRYTKDSFNLTHPPNIIV